MKWVYMLYSRTIFYETNLDRQQRIDQDEDEDEDEDEDKKKRWRKRTRARGGLLILGELLVSLEQNGSLTVAAGSVGMGCETGSRPSLMRFALSLSFSQAVAKICSACTEVK